MTVRDDRLHAAGDVDSEGAERLRIAVVRSSRGGTVRVTVDLAEVSLLTSAGVQVLVEAVEAGAVRLRAPMGSPAQHVLELVNLPYES